MIDLNKLKQSIDDAFDEETKESIMKFIDDNIPSEDEYIKSGPSDLQAFYDGLRSLVRD